MMFATLIATLVARLVSFARRGQEIDAMSARDLADIGIDGQSQILSGRPPARW